MKTSRRTFVKTGTVAALGIAFFPSSCASSTGKNQKEQQQKEMVGLQLYSVRDDMSNDPLGTLKQLAGMGYVYVEHANYIDRKFYGYSPADFRKILDDLGLKMISGHTVMAKDDWDPATNDFSDKWKYTIEDAATLGQHWVVSPWMDESMRDNYDDFKGYMDVFNKCGELCKQHGMKFGYHNHDFEFSESLNGQELFDIMMQSLDPTLVSMELDIGNLYNGGAVALDVMKKYPGRFDIIHVKDEIPSTGGEAKYESTILGQGIVDTQKVLELAKDKGGTYCYIIEQESYGDKTPMYCAKADLDIMKKWGYGS